MKVSCALAQMAMQTKEIMITAASALERHGDRGSDFDLEDCSGDNILLEGSSMHCSSFLLEMGVNKLLEQSISPCFRIRAALAPRSHARPLLALPPRALAGAALSSLSLAC